VESQYKPDSPNWSPYAPPSGRGMFSPN